MALRVVTDESKFIGNNKATVVVEGASIEEVQSTAAKNLAIAHAATLGVSRPGVQFGSGPYPVAPDGSTDMAAVTAAGRDRKYRADYPVQGGL